MEKLVNRFEEIQTRIAPNGVTLVILDEYKCAEEAKKLAIAFAKSLNGVSVASWNLEHSYYEMFDNFINNYYE